MPANLENSAVTSGLEKISFQPIPKGNAKECSKYHTIALISHASKVLLKIPQARLQQYVDHELPDVQAGFRKGRRTRDQTDSLEKTLMLGKVEGGRRRGQQRMRWLDGITDSMDMSEQSLGIGDGHGGLACCSPWGHKVSDMTERLN